MVITVPKDYKYNVSSQSPVSDLSQKKDPVLQNKISFHRSHNSLKNEVETQEVSGNAPSIARHDPKNPQKHKTCEPDSSKWSKWKNKTLTDCAFLTSNVMPPHS